MGFFDQLFGRTPEQRGTLEDPSVPISDANIIKFLGLETSTSFGESVSIEKALGVPSVWAAINFLSETMASLPLQLHEEDEDGASNLIKNDLSRTIGKAINDGASSYDWRKYSYDRLFTVGRQYTFIERNTSGRIINLWALDPGGMTVKRRNGRIRYHFRDGTTREVIYEPREIIDLAFMLHADGVNHYSPIMNHKETMGLAIAANKYGARYFNRGGVPPFVIQGPFKSPQAIQHAGEDVMKAVEQAAAENKPAMALPMGHEVKELGANPDKAQLVELKRFIVEEIARIYGLPPVFLQDLTHGTFSNTEQQDLHLVKHRIVQLVTQAEQEFNLKLFGRRAQSKRFVKFNVDGLLRGDFKTRMEGYHLGVGAGILKPNEGRALEDRPTDPDGDKLMIQSATVPISSLPTEPAAEPEPVVEPPADNDNEDERNFRSLINGLKIGVNGNA